MVFNQCSAGCVAFSTVWRLSMSPTTTAFATTRCGRAWWAAAWALLHPARQAWAPWSGLALSLPGGWRMTRRRWSGTCPPKKRSGPGCLWWDGREDWKVLSSNYSSSHEFIGAGLKLVDFDGFTASALLRQAMINHGICRKRTSRCFWEPDMIWHDMPWKCCSSSTAKTASLALAWRFARWTSLFLFVFQVPKCPQPNLSDLSGRMGQRFGLWRPPWSGWDVDRHHGNGHSISGHLWGYHYMAGGAFQQSSQQEVGARGSTGDPIGHANSERYLWLVAWWAEQWRVETEAASEQFEDCRWYCQGHFRLAVYCASVCLQDSGCSGTVWLGGTHKWQTGSNRRVPCDEEVVEMCRRADSRFQWHAPQQLEAVPQLEATCLFGFCFLWCSGRSH